MTRYLACTHCNTIYSVSSGSSCYGCGLPMTIVGTEDEWSLSDADLKAMEKAHQFVAKEGKDANTSRG